MEMGGQYSIVGVGGVCIYANGYGSKTLDEVLYTAPACMRVYDG